MVILIFKSIYISFKKMGLLNESKMDILSIKELQSANALLGRIKALCIPSVPADGKVPPLHGPRSLT